MTTPCFRPRPCLCVMFWTRFLHPITITDPSTQHLTAVLCCSIVPKVSCVLLHPLVSPLRSSSSSWLHIDNICDSKVCACNGGCGCSSTCKVSHLIMIPPSDLWRWALLISPRPVIWLLQQHEITNSAAVQPPTSPHFLLSCCHLYLWSGLDQDSSLQPSAITSQHP